MEDDRHAGKRELADEYGRIEARDPSLFFQSSTSFCIHVRKRLQDWTRDVRDQGICGIERKDAYWLTGRSG